MDNIMVSINCIAYNHEKYIRKTLDGFVMQKTNFKYEILIHDDASTDKTADIIREYEKKYPDIIKPIYQTENQFSKAYKKISTFNTERAIGKYIAMCEGDDYWTDENKLQKQFDYMEAHPDCTLCLHSGYYIYENGEKTGEMFQAYNYDTDIPIKDIIEKWICPTASIFIKTNIIANMPDYYKTSPVGDFCFLVHAAANGTVHYINEPMCVYRRASLGSATIKITKSPDKLIRFNNRYITMLAEMDACYNYKYTKYFKVSEYKHLYSIAKLENNKKNMRKYLVLSSKTLPFKKKLAVYISTYFPCGKGIMQGLSTLRGKLNG